MIFNCKPMSFLCLWSCNMLAFGSLYENVWIRSESNRFGPKRMTKWRTNWWCLMKRSIQQFLHWDDRLFLWNSRIFEMNARTMHTSRIPFILHLCVGKWIYMGVCTDWIDLCLKSFDHWWTLYELHKWNHSFWKDWFYSKASTPNQCFHPRISENNEHEFSDRLSSVFTVQWPCTQE